jgi:Nuclease-related domain
VNYPRRQQFRRLGRAVATGTGILIAAGMALLAGSQGGFWIAIPLLLVAIALGASARNWARLAGRSRMGARSEEHVQRALAPLAAEGWRLRHSLPWQSRGDIDSVAIAPTGIAFAIETKTRTFNDQHVARVKEIASWLRARRRRWCPEGSLAVLCVVHARRLERVEAGVLIVSPDRLVGALRTASGTRQRPRFLGGPASPQPNTSPETDAPAPR